jgi:hypothetical protein
MKNNSVTPYVLFDREFFLYNSSPVTGRDKKEVITPPPSQVEIEGDIITPPPSEVGIQRDYNSSPVKGGDTKRL